MSLIVFLEGILTRHYPQLQPSGTKDISARNSTDLVDRIEDQFEKLYGLVDDITINGLKLSNVNNLIDEVYRCSDDLLAIKAQILAQEATRDIFEVTPL